MVLGSSLSTGVRPHISFPNCLLQNCVVKLPIVPLQASKGRGELHVCILSPHTKREKRMIEYCFLGSVFLRILFWREGEAVDFSISQFLRILRTLPRYVLSPLTTMVTFPRKTMDLDSPFGDQPSQNCCPTEMQF